VLKAKTPRLFNLMWPVLGAGIGTNYFKNRANVLDQFLISKGLLTSEPGLKVRPETTQVVRFPEMVGDDYPVPIRFWHGERVNRNGFSDHYPIDVVIDEDD